MLSIITVGVVNVAVTGESSTVPVTDRSPAGTVTVSFVEPGRWPAAGVNWASRVSFHRHVPAIAGSIVAIVPCAAPTSATATIGSTKRTRSSASRATSPPAGKICGGCIGTTRAGCAVAGASGRSETARPVGATNAIGVAVPTVGGFADGGRMTAGCALSSAGNGSSRASNAAVSAWSSGVAAKVVSTDVDGNTVSSSAPFGSLLNASVGRCAGPDATASGADVGVGTVRGVGVVQAQHASPNQIMRRMDPCDTAIWSRVPRTR